MKAGGLRLYRHAATGVDDAIERVVLEAVALANGPADRTSIMVFDAGLESFDVFLDVVAGCEIVLEDMALSSTIQLAHFHPQYRFIDTDSTAAANFSNRSPYPAIHLLLVQDVTRAIADHPDTLSIAQRNVEYLSGLSRSALEELQYGPVD